MGGQHEKTREVINRLSRITGHIEAIKKMVEEGRDCGEVLIQMAAVKSALNNAGKVILKDHIKHCVADAVANNDEEAIESLNKAIDQFVK